MCSKAFSAIVKLDETTVRMIYSMRRCESRAGRPSAHTVILSSLMARYSEVHGLLDPRGASSSTELIRCFLTSDESKPNISSKYLESWQDVAQSALEAALLKKIPSGQLGEEQFGHTWNFFSDCTIYLLPLNEGF